MNDSRRNLIVIGALVLVVVTFVLVRMFSTPDVHWYATYRANDENPYGAYVLSNLLETLYPEKEYILGNRPLQKGLLENDDLEGPTNYIFMGRSAYLMDEEVNGLLDFVKEGNVAMFLSNNPTYALMKNMIPSWQAYNRTVDSTVGVSFVHPQLAEKTDEFTHVRNHKGSEREWGYIDSTYIYDLPGTIDSSFIRDLNSDYLEVDSIVWTEKFDTAVLVPPIIELGFINEQKVNFYRLQYGKGYFYFHCNPIMFTNYFLMNEDHLQYAENVLSHLPEGNIYWDEGSKSYRGGGNQGYKPRHGSGPLQFILDHESLRWALYLLLAMVVLYVLFRAKRQQRAIPVIEPNTNTSMEFIDTIGRLYFREQNHKDLALKKMQIFLAYIRERYHLSTGELDERFRQVLSAKSQIDREEIDMLIKQFKVVEQANEISEISLVYFHNRIEHFYKNCK